jgi:methyltransferase (TIGR00027 family)
VAALHRILKKERAAMEPGTADEVAREPSFTAMWHAWMRNAHATAHASPIFTDTRSVQLVSESTRREIVTLMDGFSQEAADALILMAVIRFRVLADRLAGANERGIRQLVILGAGLDTTVFSLPQWGKNWETFEVDHPATQQWKRQEMARLGWALPTNLIFAPCDFETQNLLSALDLAGFDRRKPALLSLFGVILYLTRETTKALLSDLASLAPGSEVIMTYSPPSDGTDPAVQQVWDRSSPKVDETGESFIGHYPPLEIERLAMEAGFSSTTHYSVDALNAEYLCDRPDGLKLHPIEQLLVAVC